MFKEFADGAAIQAPTWPSFKGKASLVGASSGGRVTVYVDSSLGAPAMQNAQDLLADSNRVMTANDDIFGMTGGPVNVIVFAMDGNTDGTGGADHSGCDFTTGPDIEVCASYGNSSRVSALFEAELSECCMGGELCGYSTGEALSRWCAAAIGNNALADFATAPEWVHEGMKNFVDRTDPSDQHPGSTGCGMAFISWLLSQNYTLSQIARSMISLGDGGTFARLYSALTSKAPNQAWPAFHSAVQAVPGGVRNDDPFGGMPGLAHLALAAVPNSTLELAGKIFSAILADLASNNSADKIASSVRGVLAAHGTLIPPASRVCRLGSRRLLPPRATV